jgi:hypothetical protein
MSAMKDHNSIRFGGGGGGRGSLGGFARNLVQAGVAVFANASIGVKVSFQLTGCPINVKLKLTFLLCIGLGSETCFRESFLGGNKLIQSLDSRWGLSTSLPLL